jgi:hypothetical protein
MNAQERLDYLLESEWVATNKSVLFADITEVIGLEATALVVGTIKAASTANPLMETILIAMSTVGLSLSTQERQSVIDSLAVAGSWPDSVRDAVKALGGVDRPRWQSEGYESVPTIESVQAEIDVKTKIIHRAAITAAIKHASADALEEIESVESLPTISELLALIESRISINWPGV